MDDLCGHQFMVELVLELELSVVELTFSVVGLWVVVLVGHVVNLVVVDTVVGL